MNTSEIETLHNRALLLYVEGRYSEAKHAWETILSDAPDDSRAVEGVQMVLVLAGEWGLGSEADEATGSLDAGGGLGPLSRSIAKVEDLLRRGQYQDAVVASRVLCEAHPHSAEVQALAGRARECFESEPFISSEIGRAMVALQLGDIEQARAACELVLELEPGHRQALALLALGNGSSKVGSSAQPASARPQPTPARSQPSLIRSEESATGSLFEMPLGAVSSIGMAPEGAAPSSFGTVSRTLQGPASAAKEEGPFFELTEDAILSAPGEALELQGAGGESGESAHDGNGKESQATSASPRTATVFSELDAEIDQSQAASTEGDFDLTAPGAEPFESEWAGGATDSAPGPASTPAESSDLDFGGGFDDSSEMPEGAQGSDWEGLNAAVAASGAGPEARTAALIREAHEFLEAKRYSEAIESAARAFAIDPDAPGAQQLIDEARSRQEDADRGAEESLYSARKHFSEGKLDEAEALYRKVLETHPGHREVIEALDMLSRRRREEEIQTAPKVDARAESREAPVPEPTIPPPARKRMPPEVEIAPVKVAMTEPQHAPRSHSGNAGSMSPEGLVAQGTVKSADPAKKKRKLPLRLSLLGALAAGLVLAVLLGVKLAGKFLGPGKPPSDLAPASAAGAARHPKGPAPGVPQAKAPNPAVAHRAAYPRTLQTAKTLVSDGKLDDAREVLTDVVGAQPGDLQAVALLDSVNERIKRRDDATKAMSGIEYAYKQGRYDDALRMLYRLPPELQKGDVERQKANAWYNNGIQFLLGGNLQEATHCFDEALAINPGDSGARDLKAYAAGYENRSKDLAYFAYVESLPKRPLKIR